MSTSTSRLIRLRSLMKGPPVLKAYIVPTGDAHQSEYISDSDARRAFITGFTGSAGTAIITPEEALLWTDARYYLQAESQLDSNWKLMKETLPTTLSKENWLVKNLPPKSNIGACPLFLSNTEWETLQTALHKAGHSLIPVENDLIDIVWNDDETEKPAQTANPIFPLLLKYSGKSVAEKLITVRKKMAEKHAEILIVTALDEIAYLFNLRGSDIQYNPVFFAYAIVTSQPDTVYLITRLNLLEDQIHTHFNKEDISSQIKLMPYDDALNIIKDVVTKSLGSKDTINVWISHGSSRAVHLAANPDSSRVNPITEITPIANMKAVKNEVEAQGLINCHIRDGAALANFFSWLENEIVVNKNETITEISAADKLEEIRSQLPDYVGLSFSTISASGPNGAIIHYKPEESTNRLISANDLYLCDSGAQFWDGTTDVTRTVHFGIPTQKQKEAFTLVLKGQIALAVSVFPPMIKGNVLDTIARRFLWQMGMNYGHGTGHGIGHFLNVHEGPMGISWKQLPDDPGLGTNMFLSNEPGYYEDGEFGIRLEDIVRIVTIVPPGNITKDLPKGLKGNFAGQGALGFETVTMAPIQKKMIDLNMLTDKEIQHIDEYHANVFKRVSPILDNLKWDSAKHWLLENTKPLKS